MRHAFEASDNELAADLDEFVDSLIASLQSEFLIMPKGEGFVDYPTFEKGYEAIRLATDSFRNIQPQKVNEAVLAVPVALVVLRTMLGFTPPEWAYVTTAQTSVSVTQGAIRSLDRAVRLSPLKADGFGGPKTRERILALVTAACRLLQSGAPRLKADELHRLDKADTKEGQDSLVSVCGLGGPYPMLLYERFLGRPFAGHRDSVSEILGDVLECKIEKALSARSFRSARPSAPNA
ncbi:MAG: hypothetical protein ACE15C_10710 [Phycisphaerae bacterium]